MSSLSRPICFANIVDGLQDGQLRADRDAAWVVTASAGERGTHDYGGLFGSDPSGAMLRGQVRVAVARRAQRRHF